METRDAQWLEAACRSPFAHEELCGDGSALVVDLREPPDRPPAGGTGAEVGAALAPVPRPVIGVCGADEPPTGGSVGAALDVTVATMAEAVALAGRADAHPQAAAALVLLLRASEDRPVPAGLVAESATYSLLQGGPEHHAWLAARDRPTRPPETAPPLRVDVDAGVLTVTFDRPHVRNAFDARTRDALVEALAVATADPTLAVELRGVGPHFGAGGDLDEFGRRPDPVTAHLTRLTRSPALVLSRLADRTTAHLHGACYGAGIEVPAFAGRVVAAPDTRIALPELGLGLVPGAGGTVSLPRRIGRQRTARLALSTEPVDADTALAWGLVDAVDAVDEGAAP